MLDQRRRRWHNNKLTSNQSLVDFCFSFGHKQGRLCVLSLRASSQSYTSQSMNAWVLAPCCAKANSSNRLLFKLAVTAVCLCTAGQFGLLSESWMDHHNKWDQELYIDIKFLVRLGKHQSLKLSQQTQDVESMLVLRWSGVVDGGPTSNQHWFNVLCLLGYWFISLITGPDYIRFLHCFISTLRGHHSITKSLPVCNTVFISHSASSKMCLSFSYKTIIMSTNLDSKFGDVRREGGF